MSIRLIWHANAPLIYSNRVLFTFYEILNDCLIDQCMTSYYIIEFKKSSPNILLYFQVVSPSGEYVDAKPIPGCIVVNAGDMLQIWSGKKIKSTRHRVVVPDNLNKPRQSIAYFVHPNNKSDVTDLENPDSGVPVNAFEYLMKKFGETY